MPLSKVSQKAFSTVLGLVFLIVSGTTLFAAQTTNEKNAVAIVNGVAITKAELDRGVDQVKRLQNMQSRQGQPMKEMDSAALQKELLESLIKAQLLYQAAQKAGMTVDDAKVESQIGHYKSRYPNPEDFKKFLKGMNITEDQLKDQVREALAVREFVDKEFKDKTTVSEEEIKAFYDAHPEHFKQPEQVHAAHILAKVDDPKNEKQKAAAKAKIEKAQARLKKGDDFATVAEEMSEGPSGAKGGDLGFFPRGRMVKQFEDAAFALQPGEVSGIVETQFGYHIIKVYGKKPAGMTPLDEVQAGIKRYLEQQKSQELMTAYVENLEKKADIKRLLPEKTE